jgi:hypothetical protein
MSRMYRVRVSDSIEKLIHVADGVASDLELLPVLERGRMVELLAAELDKRGFSRDGDIATRQEGEGVVITVELPTGRVTVRAESEQQVAVAGERAASLRGPDAKIEESMREKLHQQLERDVQHREDALQRQTTERLERRLRDLREEMDGVVNRVTIEALKERAGQLGEIEELTEDAATGELTIKVKV